MVKLKPTIASYSGAGYQGIKATLTKEYLNVITQIAISGSLENVEPHIVEDLTEMHVLAEETGNMRLDTAVFLRDDIILFRILY